MTPSRYRELHRMRDASGRVPFRYRQVIDGSGRIGSVHPDGLSEAEHAEVLALFRLLPAHLTYEDALRFLADREAMERELDEWRAKESGRAQIAAE